MCSLVRSYWTIADVRRAPRKSSSAVRSASASRLSSRPSRPSSTLNARSASSSSRSGGSSRKRPRRSRLGSYNYYQQTHLSFPAASSIVNRLGLVSLLIVLLPIYLLYCISLYQQFFFSTIFWVWARNDRPNAPVGDTQAHADQSYPMPFARGLSTLPYANSSEKYSEAFLWTLIFMIYRG